MTVFINKGDAPISAADLDEGTQRHIDVDWPAWKRERAVRMKEDASLKVGARISALNAYMVQVAADTDTNRANNLFNEQLAAYRKATARLAQVELSVGRAAYDEQIDTGQTTWDDTLGKMVPVMETIQHPPIMPLPATVDGWDNTDPMNPVAARVPNPAIVQDEAERAEAQAVVDATPAAVKAFK